MVPRPTAEGVAESRSANGITKGMFGDKFVRGDAGEGDCQHNDSCHNDRLPSQPWLLINELRSDDGAVKFLGFAEGVGDFAVFYLAFDNGAALGLDEQCPALMEGIAIYRGTQRDDETSERSADEGARDSEFGGDPRRRHRGERTCEDLKPRHVGQQVTAIRHGSTVGGAWATSRDPGLDEGDVLIARFGEFRRSQPRNSLRLG